MIHEVDVECRDDALLGATQGQGIPRDFRDALDPLLRQRGEAGFPEDLLGDADDPVA